MTRDFPTTVFVPTAFAVVYALLALAVLRNSHRTVEIGPLRYVALHGFAIATLDAVFCQRGSEWAHAAQTCSIVGACLAVAVTLASGFVRSRSKTMVLQRFFSRRYDYRQEWIRCINALTAPDATTLHKRAVRAAAEVVDSPAGVLFVRPPQDVAFQWAGSWNMPAVAAPVSPGHPLVAKFRDGNWIVRLDEHAGSGDWFPEIKQSWVVVPLNHVGGLIGFVVLVQPRARTKPGREAFDLLRVIGREIASRVAEQRAMQVLTQSRQLHEYNQRFTFAVHDIKNVSAQLSMLLANAKIYVDDPEFQRDILATVRASVGRITRLLSRLQAEYREREDIFITPSKRIHDLIAAYQKKPHQDIMLSDRTGGAGATIDPDAFDTVAIHLLNNAVEASTPGSVVEVDMRVEAHGVIVDIIDHGMGMAPEFVRDELFHPLRSTKSGGQGIGAYQARELLRDAGGDLLVLSQPDAGTTMRIVLPSVRLNLAEPASAEV